MIRYGRGQVKNETSRKKKGGIHFFSSVTFIVLGDKTPATFLASISKSSMH